jgi:hypothetical protein
MKNKLTILGVILVVITCLCLEANTTTDVDTDIKYMSASWPKRYSSISELANDDRVDLIISGTVVDSQEYQKYAKNGPGWYMKTNYTISINSIHYGKFDEKVIQVHQTGGHREDVLIMFIEDPLMAIDDEYVLFLHKYTSDEYYVVGGPQGRFVINDELIYSLGEFTKNDEVSSLTHNLDTGGVKIDKFVSLLNLSI